MSLGSDQKGTTPFKVSVDSKTSEDSSKPRILIEQETLNRLGNLNMHNCKQLFFFEVMFDLQVKNLFPPKGVWKAIIHITLLICRKKNSVQESQGLRNDCLLLLVNM